MAKKTITDIMITSNRKKETFLKSLDKRTEEIMETMVEMFEEQNKTLEVINEKLDAIRLDQRQKDVRLSDHDVRIEKLEHKVI